MKNRIGIVLLIVGIIATICGGYWVYDVKYHRMFWTTQQEFQAMIPGIILGVVGFVVLVVGIYIFVTGGKEHITDEQPRRERTGPPLGTFKRLTGVITNPVATFEDIRKRPDFLTPIILMLLTSIIAGSIIIPIALDARFEKLVEETPEVADRVDAMRTVGYIIGMVSAAVVPLVIWVVMAALIHVFAGLAGGEGEFKPLLSVLGYAGIPNYLKAIVITIIAFISGTPRTKLGLDLLFKPENNVGKIINVVLGNIEIFNLWNIALVIVGISVVKEMSREQAVIPWAIWWIIITALQIVGALFRDGAMTG